MKHSIIALLFVSILSLTGCSAEHEVRTATPAEWVEAKAEQQDSETVPKESKTEQEPPVEEEKPIEQEPPVEVEKLIEQEPPVEEEKLIEQEPPAEEEKPVEQEPPAEEEKPVEQEREDPNEIKEPLSYEEEWLLQLNKNNSSFQESDLDHDVIQSILKEKGITGLNKYQYHQVLKEENADDFVLDELLIIFNVKEPKFSNDEYNALFTAVEQSGLFCLCTLKQTYSSEKLLDLIGILINDPNVAFIQPNFIYTFS